MAFYRTLVELALILISLQAAAQPPAAPTRLKSEFTRDEQINDFALMYGIQWIGYIATQHEIIRRTGRFENMFKNPFRPHLDNDTYDYNVFKHAVTGNYYYLYYRSKGHDVKSAFLWSATSSLAFEFAIETLTERPSFQDMYHTPELGTLLGIGSEHISRTLMQTQNPVLRFIGLVFNPFALWPGGAYDISAAPYTDRDSSGFFVRVDY